MLLRRRPLARAAMPGGAGYLAYRAGKNVQQQQAEAAYPPPPPPTPPGAAAGPADVTAQRVEALSRLKELLDVRLLSPGEFDAHKRKLLEG